MSRGGWIASLKDHLVSHGGWIGKLKGPSHVPWWMDRKLKGPSHVPWWMDTKLKGPSLLQTCFVQRRTRCGRGTADTEIKVPVDIRAGFTTTSQTDPPSALPPSSGDLNT